VSGLNPPNLLPVLVVLQPDKHTRTPVISHTRCQPCSSCKPAGIVTVVGGKYYNGELKIVGKIPAGLPPLTIGKWAPIENLPSLFRLAVVVMVVDLLESTSIAR